MTNNKQFQQRANEKIMPLYANKGVALDRADGSYVYDVEGNKYLDCAAGIAVVSLGHNHPAFKRAITEQINKGFTMPTGSFTTQPKVLAAELLTDNCCAEQVFFCNSGAEAVEGSIKLARAWAHYNRGHDVKDIIVFRNSFHGRTYGAVSATEKSLHQDQFAPYLPGFHFAEFNNLQSVQDIIDNNKNICAVMVEPVQGEGGLNPGTTEFLTGLQKLCNDNQILMISDEIQAGMGRMGTLMAHAHFGYEPDIIALAKGLGSGFPVGAFMAKKAIADAFQYGDHGTTYGGNPLATNVVYHVVSELIKPEFLDHVKQASAYFREKLSTLQAETGNVIHAIKGEGLMVGLDTKYKCAGLLDKLLQKGLITTQAGKNTLRLTPPLTISFAEIDEAVAKIADVLNTGDLEEV